MKKYIIKVTTTYTEFEYFTVEAKGLEELSDKCKELIRNNPGKVIVDFEVAGGNL